MAHSARRVIRLFIVQSDTFTSISKISRAFVVIRTHYVTSNINACNAVMLQWKLSMWISCHVTTFAEGVTKLENWFMEKGNAFILQCSCLSEKRIRPNVCSLSRRYTAWSIQASFLHVRLKTVPLTCWLSACWTMWIKANYSGCTPHQGPGTLCHKNWRWKYLTR